MIDVLVIRQHLDVSMHEWQQEVDTGHLSSDIRGILFDALTYYLIAEFFFFSSEEQVYFLPGE